MGILTTVAEELVKKGHKVEGLISPKVASDIDNLAKKAAVAGFDSKALSRTENVAIKTATESLLNGLKKADGTISKSAVFDLQQAYGKALVKEFGDGPQAKAALTLFQESVSTAWTQQRALARGTDVASAAPAVARVDARVAGAVNANAPTPVAVRTTTAPVVTDTVMGPAERVIQPDAIRRSGAVPPNPADRPAPRPAQGGAITTPASTSTAPAPVGSRAPVAAGEPRQIADEVVPPRDGFEPNGRRTTPADVVDVDAREVNGAATAPATIPGPAEAPSPAAARTAPVDNSITPEPGDFTTPPTRSQPVQQAAAPAPQPAPVGGVVDDNQTAAEKAARARVAAEDAIKFRDATFGARTAITQGVREFDQGGFVAKKAALDKIASNIEGSGLLIRPGSADEAAAMAKAGNSADRSLDEVKGILLTRPGQDANGQFINGVIKVSEWNALRKVMRGDMLSAEQKALADSLDVVRKSQTVKLKPEDIKQAFVRLREISEDPDYKANVASRAQGATPAGTTPTAAAPTTPPVENVDLGTPRKVQEALAAGKPVDRDALNRLETYYTRYHAEQPPVTTNPSMLSTALSFVTGGKFGGKPGVAEAAEASSMDRIAEWETGRRFVKPSATAARLGLGALGVTAVAGGIGTGGAVFFNPEMEDGITKTVGVTTLSTVGGLGLPGGTSGNMYSEAIALKAQTDPGIIGRMQARTQGDTFTSPAINDAVAFLTANKQKTVTAQRELDTQQQGGIKAEVAKGQAGAVQSVGQSVAQGLAGVPEKGVSVLEADNAVTELATTYSLIGLDEMQKLAQVIAEKSKGGAADVMTRQEYESVKQDKAYTGIPMTAQKKLDELMGPKLIP